MPPDANSMLQMGCGPSMRPILLGVVYCLLVIEFNASMVMTHWLSFLCQAILFNLGESLPNSEIFFPATRGAEIGIPIILKGQNNQALSLWVDALIHTGATPSG